MAWGNATARYNTPAGQGAKITFTDGVTTKFTRLERPHLVFKSNQVSDSLPFTLPLLLAACWLSMHVLYRWSAIRSF